MVTADFVSELKQDLRYRYQQKYGRVSIDFDEFLPQGERVARVQFTISDGTGFITRYYGLAGYREDELYVDVAAI